MSVKTGYCCRYLLIALLFFFISNALESQTKVGSTNGNTTVFGSGSISNNQIVNLTVSVRINNIQGSAPPTLRIHITNSRTSLNLEGFTDEKGEARFANIPYGDYAMEISGDIEGDTVNQRFTILAGDFQHTEMVTVKYKTPVTLGNDNTAGYPIAISELSVPQDAFDELHKGWADFQKKKYPEANKHYHAALAMYPKYASAMNSLGVLSLSQKDEVGAGKWFEQAIGADASFPDPYFHLARLARTRDDYPAIQQNLLKYTAIVPQNIKAIVMLAEAQMYNGNLDDAIGNTRKVHSMDHRSYTEVHIIAARALERKHLPNESIAEYLVYLKESPDGIYAQNVHQTLELMAQKYELPIKDRIQ